MSRHLPTLKRPLPLRPSGPRFSTFRQQQKRLINTQRVGVRWRKLEVNNNNNNNNTQRVSVLRHRPAAFSSTLLPVSHPLIRVRDLSISDPLVTHMFYVG